MAIRDAKNANSSTASINPNTVARQLESLTGANRLDASAIKNIDTGGYIGLINFSGNMTQFANATKGSYWKANTSGSIGTLTFAVGDQLSCKKTITGTPTDLSDTTTWAINPNTNAIATSSLAGMVKPDGTVITVDAAGAITAAKATTSALGVVSVDSTTLSVDSNGKLSSKILAATYSVVATQAAMLALPTKTNLQICQRTDTNRIFYLNANSDPTVLANWVDGGSTTSAVLSFNTRTGTITPTVGDYLAYITSFSSTRGYATGEVVRQGGVTYIANQAVATGAFDSAKFDRLVPIATTTVEGIAKVGGVNGSALGTAAAGTSAVAAAADHVHPYATSVWNTAATSRQILSGDGSLTTLEGPSASKSSLRMDDSNVVSYVNNINYGGTDSGNKGWSWNTQTSKSSMVLNEATNGVQFILKAGGSLSASPTTAANSIRIWCDDAQTSLEYNSSTTNKWSRVYLKDNFYSLNIDNKGVMSAKNSSGTGYVGINQDTPLAPLHVEGIATISSVNPYSYIIRNTSNTTGTLGGVSASYIQTNNIPGAAGNISIYTPNRMLCAEFDLSSDYRAKKDIVDIDYNTAVEVVKKNRPVHYLWKEGCGGGDTRPRTGFISQWVGESGFGEAVNISFGKIRDENNELQDVQDFHTLEVMPMLSVAWKALQFALEKIEALETKLSSLEKK